MSCPSRIGIRVLHTCLTWPRSRVTSNSFEQGSSALKCRNALKYVDRAATSPPPSSSAFNAKHSFANLKSNNLTGQPIYSIYFFRLLTLFHLTDYHTYYIFSSSTDDGTVLFNQGSCFSEQFNTNNSLLGKSSPTHCLNWNLERPTTLSHKHKWRSESCLISGQNQEMCFKKTIMDNKYNDRICRSIVLADIFKIRSHPSVEN